LHEARHCRRKAARDGRDRDPSEIRLIREAVEAKTQTTSDEVTQASEMGQQGLGLKVWLVVFTIAIVALTAVHAWPELKHLWGQR